VERWNEAESEVRRALGDSVREGGMLPYPELAERVMAIRLASDSSALAHLIGEVVERVTVTIRTRYDSPRPRMFPVAVTFLMPARLGEEGY
jgi:hypothetical protein